MNSRTNRKVKEWKVPGDLAAIMEEAIAAEALRDVYAGRLFGFKKALRCSKLAVSRRNEFWDGVKKLYPDIPKKAHFNRTDKVIREGLV